MATGGPGGFASAVLARAGIGTLYGDPASDLPVVPAEWRIAGVLARAHRVVWNAPAGAVTAVGTIDIPGGTGAEPEVIVISDCADATGVVERIQLGIRAGGVRIQLEVDPTREWDAGAGAPAPADPWLIDHGEVIERINQAGLVLVLAGPGVVAAHAVPGLHSLSSTLGAGVVNTWGAKGIFHWRSRHHWATIGLQEYDFHLAGFEVAQLVLATGVDDREAPGSAWRHRPGVVVAPEALGPLSEMLPARGMTAGLPPLRTRLAAVTQRGWESTTTPLLPSRAILHYGRQLAPGGLVAADAGLAGFWVARTFATTRLGTVAVPAVTDHGWAAACVAVARLGDPLRPALAVVDEQVDETTSLVIEFAARHRIDIGIEVWSADGEALEAARHEQRLEGLVAPTGGGEATLATEPAQLEDFVAVAGPVRDWSGRRQP